MKCKIQQLSLAGLPMLGIIAAVFFQSLEIRAAEPAEQFDGNYVAGEGSNVVALKELNAAFASMHPSAKMACLPLLYKRDWDGLVEGPTWPCWWIQNSFGPSFAMMPFLGEPYATWLEHSQAMWFKMMGDGHRKDCRGLQGPDGCLCDAAFIYVDGGAARGFDDFRRGGGGVEPQLDGKIHSEGTFYKQGDGPTSEDWFIGATDAGLILESERLLVRHDVDAAKQRLPQLERVAAFLDSRRDRDTNLLKGGRASNLLAPGYLGWRTSNLTFKQAYLTELSVNYVAGLERLAEVCDLCGAQEKAQAYRFTAVEVREALPKLMTPEGYFVMSKDPDGTLHGVYGAEKHGYFEATPNHDAGCFEVTDDAQNKKIVEYMLHLKGKSAPGGLIPYGLVIPNYPSYDDSAGGEYGRWVNGGHWTTTQGRMSIACMRANEFAHPFEAWSKIRALMEGFRADAPLPGFGSAVWNGGTPYNVVYDCWGAPGGLVRGLFEYEYLANGLRIRVHLPPGITRYVQKAPVYFGKTKIYLTVTGTGAAQKADKDGWIELHPDGKPGVLAVEIVRGDAKPQGAWQPQSQAAPKLALPDDDPGFWQLEPFAPPTSGNDNPLCIGASPDGGLDFNGEIRDVHVYRRPLDASGIAALARGKAPAGALISVPPPASAPVQLVARSESGHLELPPSADIDFQDNFTLAASIRPSSHADGRLIDRTSAGTMNGYLLDTLQGGKILRLLTPWGVAQGPVNLTTGQWQNVAATCTTDGLMRVYFNGARIAEARGRKPAAETTAPRRPLDLHKVAAFYRALVKAGLQDSYEAAEARTTLELLVARHERAMSKPAAPDLGAIPPCNPDAVDKLYFDTANWMAGGLEDRLCGRDVWHEPVAPEIMTIARQTGMSP